MIKFKNYPPTKPGDVEFTSTAVKIIQKIGPYPGGEEITQLRAYGRAVGYTLIAGVEAPTDVEREARVRMIAVPLFETVGQLIPSINSAGFESGVNHALNDERTQRMEDV